MTECLLRRKENVEIELTEETVQAAQTLCEKYNMTIDEVCELALIDKIATRTTQTEFISNCSKMTDDEFAESLRKYIIITNDDNNDAIALIIPLSGGENGDKAEAEEEAS